MNQQRKLKIRAYEPAMKIFDTYNNTYVGVGHRFSSWSRILRGLVKVRMFIQWDLEAEEETDLLLEYLWRGVNWEGGKLRQNFLSPLFLLKFISIIF